MRTRKQPQLAAAVRAYRLRRHRGSLSSVWAIASSSRLVVVGCICHLWLESSACCSTSLFPLHFVSMLAQPRLTAAAILLVCLLTTDQQLRQGGVQWRPGHGAPCLGGFLGQRCQAAWLLAAVSCSCRGDCPWLHPAVGCCCHRTCKTPCSPGLPPLALQVVSCSPADRRMVVHFPHLGPSGSESGRRTYQVRAFCLSSKWIFMVLEGMW